MPRRPAQFDRFGFTQSCIDFFQRAEETSKAVFQMLRAAAGLAEIAVAKLSRGGDHSGAHHTIFMCTLRPREAVRSIVPDGKSHAFNFR